MRFYEWTCDGCGDKTRTDDNKLPDAWRTWLIQTDQKYGSIKYETCPTCKLAFVGADGRIKMVAKTGQFLAKTGQALFKWMQGASKNIKPIEVNE